MSSVKTQSHYDASRHLSFIATAPYTSYFWTYSYTQPSPSNSFVGVGAFTRVQKLTGGDVTDVECPRGRILRANGRKIYPDSSAVPTSFAGGDRSPLIGVIDYTTGLSGFIDPNQTVFALYSVDKAIDGASEESSLTVNHNNHKGMSVYTGGNVTAAGSVSAGTSVTAGTYVSGNVVTISLFQSGLNGAAYTSGTSADVFINQSLGNVFYLDLTGTAGITSQINVYCAVGGASGAVVPISPFPAGANVTLIVKAKAAGTTQPILTVGNSAVIHFGNTATLTAATLHSLSFVTTSSLMVVTGYIAGM